MQGRFTDETIRAREKWNWSSISMTEWFKSTQKKIIHYLNAVDKAAGSCELFGKSIRSSS